MACREELGLAQPFKCLNIKVKVPQTVVLYETVQALSTTVRSVACNTLISLKHSEVGFAKAGTAQFSHGQDLFRTHGLP